MVDVLEILESSSNKFSWKWSLRWPYKLLMMRIACCSGSVLRSPMPVRLNAPAQEFLYCFPFYGAHVQEFLVRLPCNTECKPLSPCIIRRCMEDYVTTRRSTSTAEFSLLCGA